MHSMPGPHQVWWRSGVDGKYMYWTVRTNQKRGPAEFVLDREDDVELAMKSEEVSKA